MSNVVVSLVVCIGLVLFLVGAILLHVYNNWNASQPVLREYPSWVKEDTLFKKFLDDIEDLSSKKVKPPPPAIRHIGHIFTILGSLVEGFFLLFLVAKRLHKYYLDVPDPRSMNLDLPSSTYDFEMVPCILDPKPSLPDDLPPTYEEAIRNELPPPRYHEYITTKPPPHHHIQFSI